MSVFPIITCEHAGREVPAAFTHLFMGQDEILQSHRGWDPGALEIAALISENSKAPFFKCDTTRLLVEPNRSLGNAALFSEFSKILNLAERESVLNNYYYPHRNTVESWIRNAPGIVLHLSIHSFTPVWEERERKVDIGLLFDPARNNESLFCREYKKALEVILPELRIENNEPYKGIDDGFTTHLRTLFPDKRYMGIEIEVNQKFMQTQLRNTIAMSLAKCLFVADNLFT